MLGPASKHWSGPSCNRSMGCRTMPVSSDLPRQCLGAPGPGTSDRVREQNARRQDINARVNCPQLQDRVHAYTTAVEQTLADMAQLPPDRRQRPRLSTTDLPHLPTVFRAIRDYQSTVAAVQATYGTLPPVTSPKVTSPQRDRLRGLSDHSMATCCSCICPWGHCVGRRSGKSAQVYWSSPW